MSTANLISVTYVGGRDSVGKWWTNARGDARQWIFKFGQEVKVPPDFAAALIKKSEFVLTEEGGRAVTVKHQQGGVFIFRRWGALGDLLIFRAAVSAFRRHHPNYFAMLMCQERFVEIFEHDRLWQKVFQIGSDIPTVCGVPAGADAESVPAIISFDHVAEVDHFAAMHKDEAGHQDWPPHRLDLFLNAMTPPNPNQKVEIIANDWALPVPPQIQDWVGGWLTKRGLVPGERAGKVIAVQVRGSGRMKSLPYPRMKDLLKKLLDSDPTVNIILIEHEFEFAKEFLVDDRVYEMADRDALHTIELLRQGKVDLAITFDSGALWMAHCAPCPVLAILGPTRPAQRISYHPLYPDQARAVCLNEIISCPACFESAQACKGRYSCMQEQPDWNKAILAIVDEAGKMLNGQKASVCLPVLS